MQHPHIRVGIHWLRPFNNESWKNEHVKFIMMMTTIMKIIVVILLLLLSLRFNGHFPREPGLAGVHWSKGRWRWWWHLDYWSYKSSNTPVKSSPPTNQHPVFLQAGCPSCRPTKCQSTELKISHSMDLLIPSSPGGLPTLSLTINSSWLHWWRVAMPLISPLMPVPQ